MDTPYAQGAILEGLTTSPLVRKYDVPGAIRVLSRGRPFDLEGKSLIRGPELPMRPRSE